MNLSNTKLIVFKIAFIIAVIEFFIMEFLHRFTSIDNPTYISILDVLLLSVLSAPVLYIWVIKPYVVTNKNSLKQLAEIANFDPLTKLANRRLLFEHMETKLIEHKDNSTYGALLFIDLDGFKAINDQYGHDAGDFILIEVANQLSKVVRPQDIASRIGGDEFVIVLCGLAADKSEALHQAMNVSQRIQDLIESPLTYKTHTLHINSSIGVKLLSPEDSSPESNLKAADKAMYDAKKSGSGKVSVAPDNP